jgi:hypothetical protein
MGIILFWIFDTSSDRRRTRTLVDRTIPIVTRLIALGGNPLLKPLRRSVLALLRELRDEPAVARHRKVDRHGADVSSSD